MTDQDENPLVAALPPETDYLTYLTIVEYNLSKDQLPLFHELLQDTKLTANIGWDLVHLLLPLLPESEACLQDVSTLGNPRETVLKVAECLENLGHLDDSEAGDDSEEEDNEDGQDKVFRHQDNAAENVDLLSLQFQSLSHMLCVLHPRIKTKNPSKFLTTSLKAVLQAYKNVQAISNIDSPTKRLQSTTRTILMIAKSMSGSKRPNLPPRRSQSAIPQVNMGNAAPDPEGQQEEIAAGEKALQQQILQSFVIQALEIYIQTLEPIASIDSALAWSSRYHNRANLIPGRPSFSKEYDAEEQLERADATINQLLSSLEGDLHLSWSDVLKHIISEDTDHQSDFAFATPDFPISKVTLLCALAARAAASLQNDRPLPFKISIFPEHSQLTELPLDSATNDIDVDALIILGRAALDSNGLGEWETRAEFNQYLQRLVELAANASLPNLSSQASELISTILHSHPSSDARFDFIQDTLEDCPYPEFKEAAILWLKDEILSAFSLSKRPLFPGQKGEQSAAVFGETSNVFTHPETLKSAAIYVFAKPDFESKNEVAPATKARFWLAALNLWYLLNANEKLHETLQVHALNIELSISQDFLGGLVDLVNQARDTTKSGIDEGYLPYLPFMENALESR